MLFLYLISKRHILSSRTVSSKPANILNLCLFSKYEFRYRVCDEYVFVNYYIIVIYCFVLYMIIRLFTLIVFMHANISSIQ